MLGKLIRFKGKEEKAFLKAEKILNKHLSEGKKNIAYILKNTKLNECIDTIVDSNELTWKYSCYNKGFVNDVVESLLSKEFVIDDNKEEKINKYKGKFLSHVEVNINSLSTLLQRGRFDFDTPDEKQEIKENDKGTSRRGLKTRVSVEYLDGLLLDEGIDVRILSGMFHGMMLNARFLENKKYKELFKKLIAHKNFDIEILKKFMLTQTSISKESGYVKNTRAFDDIDLNGLKNMILESKRLKQSDVIKLASLPYIGLWDSMIENYYLHSPLMVDFLTEIFKYNKPDEKNMILGFLKRQQWLTYKTPEMILKIEAYRNS